MGNISAYWEIPCARWMGSWKVEWMAPQRSGSESTQCIWAADRYGVSIEWRKSGRRVTWTVYPALHAPLLWYPYLWLLSAAIEKASQANRLSDRVFLHNGRKHLPSKLPRGPLALRSLLPNSFWVCVCNDVTVISFSLNHTATATNIKCVFLCPLRHISHQWRHHYITTTS